MLHRVGHTGFADRFFLEHRWACGGRSDGEGPTLGILHGDGGNDLCRGSVGIWLGTGSCPIGSGCALDGIADDIRGSSAQHESAGLGEE